MMDVKNSNLKPKLFSDAINRIPTLSWKLLDEILNKCTQSQKPRSFMLVKSIELCSTIFKSATITTSEESKKLFVGGVKKFGKVVGEFITALPSMSETGPYSMPKDRLKTILKCLIAVIRKSKSTLDQQEFEKCWGEFVGGERLVELFGEEKYVNQKGLKAIANEINKLL